MHTVPAKQARQEFTQIVDEVAYYGERYIVTRNGRELMAMVSIKDLETLQSLENKRDVAIAKKEQSYIQKQGTISWKELEKKLGIDGK